jgi:ABC-type sugar transport system ATPase subunit/ribose/xylose/arabinose/galactoside ABC-type transport system permease subunit
MNPTQAAHDVPLMRMEGIARSFSGILALADVDLELRAGTIHALVGENGAGKSTLINILSGILQPDRGRLLLNGRQVAPADAGAARRLGIATVHQEADVFPDLSVAENLAFEHGWTRAAGWINWTALRQTTVSALRHLNCRLPADRPAAALTAAERQLVGIAAALNQKAVLLILDEPTSSLSAAETRTLFARLRQFRDAGGAVLYVSHRMDEIFELADRVTVLRDGREVWTGPLADSSPERLIALMVGRETAPSAARALTIPGAIRFQCQELTAIDHSFQDVSLEAHSGEVLALYGLVGAGRSEWAQAVFGLRPIQAGTITVDGASCRPRGPGDAARRGLAYLPEDRLRLGVCPGLSVRLNAVLATLRGLALGPFVSAAKEGRRTQLLVDRLGVRLRSISQAIGTLSGGNQQKVVVGRWLEADPKVLILDEPTRGVDVATKAEIHALLRRLADAGRAVIMISSDLPEVLAHGDRIGVFREGRLLKIWPAGAVTAPQVAAVALPTVLEADLPGNEGVSDSSVRPLASMRYLPRHTWLREGGLLIACLLLSALLAWNTDTFWLPGTLRDMGENAALLVVCGLGAGLVILAGAIDISFGSIMAFSAALTGHWMRQGWSIPLAVGAGLTLATGAGALNAALSLWGRVHPIVVTLGTMSMYRGLALILIGGQAIHEVPDAFRIPFQVSMAAIPSTAWLTVFVVVLAWLTLGWTVPGRRLLALGSNPAMAERVGIHRSGVWLTVFSLEGFLAGMAGLVALGRAGHLQGTDFEEMTLEAIGVAVVGGIAITGGRGSVWGICGAALLFRILEKGWALLHISAFWQRTIVGTLLLLSILGDRIWRRVGSHVVK